MAMLVVGLQPAMDSMDVIIILMKHVKAPNVHVLIMLIDPASEW